MMWKSVWAGVAIALALCVLSEDTESEPDSLLATLPVDVAPEEPDESNLTRVKTTEAIEEEPEVEPDFLFFTAAWCQFCPPVKKQMDRFRAEGVRVDEIDFDTNRAVASQWGVNALPSVVSVLTGEVREGARPDEEWRAFFNVPTPARSRPIERGAVQQEGNPEPVQEIPTPAPQMGTIVPKLTYQPQTRVQYRRSVRRQRIATRRLRPGR